jgi:hypothetical protein
MVNLSRRKFLRNISVGASAALLANAGLPAAFASDARVFRQIIARTGNLYDLNIPPDVELMVGDVVGFQLQTDEWPGQFGWVMFQLHKAWYNSEDVYYIRTDASDETYALENKLVHVPLLNGALAAEGATSQLYTFANGADDQFPVMSSTPANEDYSPAWHVHVVTFNGTPTVLTSVEEINAAADVGDVTVEAQQLVVNFPVVKWPGGELPEDTAKDSYLGTGPLVRPVNTEKMLVIFKLHQCYPGSRYIVTDTSAVPMAPMMNIAPAAATQKLVDVAATDEIWVFGNGIPGSGVMGFQPAVFDHPAGNPIWSPFWNHFTAVWKDGSNVRLLTNSDDLRAAADAGELEIFNGTPDTHPNGFVVNCPVPIKAANTFTVS